MVDNGLGLWNSTHIIGISQIYMRLESYIEIRCAVYDFIKITVILFFFVLGRREKRFVKMYRTPKKINKSNNFLKIVN